MIREQVVVNLHHWEEDFVVPAADFIAQLSGLLKLVPEEFKAAVVVEFDRTGSDYDFSRGEMSLYYIRNETDEEMEKRAAQAVRSQREQEARERAQLATLKAKYENPLA